MQIGSPPSLFPGRVHLHSLGGSHNADHRSFGQYFTTAHTSPLGHMLHTLNRSFLRHLYLTSLFHDNDYSVLLFFPIFAAAFVLLARHNLAALFVELERHTLLLDFLAFLLIRGVFLGGAGGLEDLGLHGEEFVQ
jgi:hypothetical protein